MTKKFKNLNVGLLRFLVFLNWKKPIGFFEAIFQPCTGQGWYGAVSARLSRADTAPYKTGSLLRCT